MEVELLEARQNSQKTWHEILAGKVMTTCVRDDDIVDPIPSKSRPCRHNDRGDDDSLVSAHLEKYSIDQCIFASPYHDSDINVVVNSC